MCQNEVVADLTERGPSMEQVSRIGMDTSKRFFQLHGVNTAETVGLRKKLRRKEMVTFFEKLAPTVGPTHDHGNGKLDHKARQASRFVQILQRARAMQAKTLGIGPRPSALRQRDGIAWGLA